jgi:peptidoglycan/LPS O-acetylase OafA/YrhL
MYIWIAILLAVAGTLSLASEVPGRRLSRRLSRQWRILTGLVYIIVSVCLAFVALDGWPEGAVQAITVAGLTALAATGILLLRAPSGASQESCRVGVGALPLVVAIAGQIAVGVGYVWTGRSEVGWLVLALGVVMIAIGCGLAYRTSQPQPSHEA